MPPKTTSQNHALKPQQKNKPSLFWLLFWLIFCPPVLVYLLVRSS